MRPVFLFTMGRLIWMLFTFRLTTSTLLIFDGAEQNTWITFLDLEGFLKRKILSGTINSGIYVSDRSGHQIEGMIILVTYKIL